MKKLSLLLLILTVSCAGQTKPLEPVFIDVPLTVSYINENEIGLFSKEVGRMYKVNPVDVELDKVYWFWLELTPCKTCKSPTGRVLEYSITPDQANRDIVVKQQKMKLIQLK